MIDIFPVFFARSLKRQTETLLLLENKIGLCFKFEFPSVNPSYFVFLVGTAGINSPVFQSIKTVNNGFVPV